MRLNEKLHLNHLDCVFSVMTPCSLGAVYHPIRVKHSLYLQHFKVTLKCVINSLDYTASHFRFSLTQNPTSQS